MDSLKYQNYKQCNSKNINQFTKSYHLRSQILFLISCCYASITLGLSLLSFSKSEHKLLESNPSQMKLLFPSFAYYLLLLLMKKRIPSENISYKFDQFSQSPLRKQIEIKNKVDSQILPLFIMPDHRIIVFTQSPIYQKIYHHLKSICEPLLRPRFVHEYKVTKFSLYTAMVLHYSGDQIVKILKKLSKNQIFPESLEQQILQYMKHAGNVRLQLINGQYYIFTTFQISLLIDQFLEQIQKVKIQEFYDFHLDQISQEMENRVIEEINQQMFDQIIQEGVYEIDIQQTQRKRKALFEEKIKEKKEKEKMLIKFKIIGDYFQVTKRLIESNIPIVQQFDFKNCQQIPNIDIQMNSDVRLRHYQQAALKNVFITSKARSGLIILPCGAGKSMIAIQLIQRIKKKSIIFCQNQTSCLQWQSQLIKWTTIQRSKVVILTSKIRPKIKQIQECSIFITTYSLIGYKRQFKNEFLQKTQKLPWAVCIADQVHKLPAQTFQQVLKKYKFYLKIGLTATPYRQDKKINNLYYMVGPKLYEQNWIDLVNQGHLANPYLVQMFCQMPQQYLNIYKVLGKSDLIHTANPNKFKVLQYIINKHNHFGDKILVFCDRPKVLQKYANLLKRPFIHGETDQQTRQHYYNSFKTIKEFNVLFLSRVGDTAIDLPCANVGIQIGVHYNSRRQEVQRMGRIMRPKDNPFNEFNAFFYTLVSIGTDEQQFCRIRHKTIVDQGFQYEIKLESSLNYQGIKLKHLDEDQHLQHILGQHKQAQTLLKRIQFLQQRDQTIKIQKGIQYQQYFYDEIQNDDQ